MVDLFIDADERAALVNDAAARLGVAPWVVEKDLWVCWMLARLVEIPGIPKLTFKGGTSLSKVHRLIHRFSEDIDLTFSRDGWGFDGERDPLRATLSGKKRRALVEEIAARSAVVVRNVVVPGLEAACRARLGQHGWSVDLDPRDDQAVVLTYPDPVAGYAYGRPMVKAEFGARGDPWPTSDRRVVPYLEDVHAGLASTAIAEVATLEPERTFWEKATLLHALHHGTLAKPDKRADRLSRHLYDLHLMWHHVGLRARLADSHDLLQAVVRNKQVFFEENKAGYDLAAGFDLRSTPHAPLELTLRADYTAMQEMFFPGSITPDFDPLLASLREIDALVAGWGNQGVKKAGPSA